jgi:hypothetical protein
MIADLLAAVVLITVCILFVLAASPKRTRRNP